ncbi:ArsB/NhaD family transporter [candidate division WOR-3 bacterium]|nr:ArsB/NhaD family transporter [candidate division WOR-3 bacterium]
MSTQAWIAVAIFVASYIAIATDKIDRSLVAVVGATIMLATGIVDQGSAFARIDLNVILLLAGMMIMISIVKRSGLFEWLAISAAKATGGRPILLLITLPLITAVTSAFLDNVTTMILIIPITLVIADTLGINPVPLIISETFASNIGGTATLIGDPPHMLIGSAANLSFLDFLTNLAPIVAIILVVFAVIISLTFGRELRRTAPKTAALASLTPKKAIKGKYLLWKSVGVLAVVFTLFVLQDALGIKPATVALIGASLLLILSQLPPREAKMDSMGVLLTEIDWPTLFFFIGMFIMVAGLEAAGVIAVVANLVVNLTRTHLLLTALLILWGSAFMTMILSAVPFVVATIPVIQSLAAQGVGPVEPLWWALSLGAALGANGTFIGSAANMVVIGISNRSGHPITFAEFTKRGLPITIISLVLSSLYIWLRYF